MKSILPAVLLAIFFLPACKAPKPTADIGSEVLKLRGTWELNYITGPRIAFDELYPNKKPMLKFDVEGKRVSGYTSCNSFNGPLKAAGTRITFNAPLAMTKMACVEGNGETVFLQTLKKVTSFSVSDSNTLTLTMGDIAMMRFTKK